MLRLSLIVPFYNSERYIEQCLRSLYNQNIPQGEYEVICVDDCSQDGSRAIVERMQKEYQSLKLLLHTQNKRQGGARNTGLKEAKGRYIWFVDSDDYIQSNSLKVLIEQAEKENLDILRFYFSFNGDISYVTKMVDTPVLSGSKAIFDIDTGEPLGIRCSSACGQLVKREYLLNNNIYFVENVQYEDDDYAYKLFAYAERVQWISVAPYIVRVTSVSTTRRRTDLVKLLDIYAQTIRIIHMDAELTNIDERWHNFIKERVYWSVTGQILPMFKELPLTQKVKFYIKTFKFIRLYKSYVGKKTYCKLYVFYKK